MTNVASEKVFEETAESCGLIRDVLALIGEKWSVIVLDQLRDGPLRFNELRRAAAPVTQRMLSGSLRGLERDGLITRTVYPTVPPKVEYELTEAGRALNSLVYGVAGWADRYLPTVTASRTSYQETR
ncbi:winged helix-turn-helix transcriptional regulator [Kribbella qitaiheensis]|uniref:winged helix-turn-helix transcriptional regulator n=1 Tax=Kribbella qitaiheensis TaxID=1544730 RepID=UPI0036090E7B